MTGADISGSRAVFLVARRELRTRVRTRGFVLSTLAMLLAVAGYLGLMTVFTDDDPSTVGLAPQHAALVGPLSAAAAERGERIEIREVTGRDAAQAQLRDSELDAWVTGSPDTLEVLVREDLDTGLRTALVDVAATRVVNAQLARAGLNPQQVQQQAAAAGVQVTSLEPVDPQRGERLVLSFAVSFLLYLALILYGTYVAQGVVEEKSSRVVELLLCTVRPWQLMFGKLIGIGLFGLLQLGLLSGAIAAGASLTGLLTVPALSSLLWMLGWFVLGYFLFAGLLAAAGARVSRQEELQSVINPALTILIVPFVLSVFLLGDDPESTLVTVLSLVPPFSPILMPARIALDVVPLWQIGVSAAVTIVAITAVVATAGRVYAGAVLRTGSRVKLADALRPM
ncbi:MAG TPA: ABC transporter permease [Pseudonocardiaceae bacterium]|jgi:ABC-2 type transport system permease protein|nr:ABC transporter permease [Pseudonocardiaceae bacterium]